jgi:hypothetical protein
VLLGNGDGSFQAPISTPGQSFSVVAGDFNGDGNMDVASNFLYSSTPLGVFLGKGDGTFLAPATYSGPTNPSGPQAGDFDGDGWLDLAISSDPDNGVLIYLNRGDGTFKPGQLFASCESPAGMSLADVNKDTRVDLVVTCVDQSGTVNVHLGNGDGTLQAPLSFATGDWPFHIVMADFNRDRKIDIATNSQVAYNGNVSVLLGNGDGTFQSNVDFPAGGYGRSLAVGDLKNDRYPDLINVGYAKSLHVVVNDASWTAPAPPFSAVDGKEWMRVSLPSMIGLGDPRQSNHVAELLGQTNAPAIEVELLTNHHAIEVGQPDWLDVDTPTQRPSRRPVTESGFIPWSPYLEYRW